MTDFGEVFVPRTERVPAAVDWDPDRNPLPSLTAATPALRRLGAVVHALQDVPALTVHDTIGLLAAPDPHPPAWLYPAALVGNVLGVIDDVPKMGVVVIPGALATAVLDHPFVAWSQLLLPAVMDAFVLTAQMEEGSGQRWFDEGLSSVPWLLLASVDAAAGPVRLADAVEALLREVRAATPPGEQPPRRQEVRDRLRAVAAGYRELGLVEGPASALLATLLGKWALTVLDGMRDDDAWSAFLEVSGLPAKTDELASGGGHSSGGAGGTGR